MPKARLWLLVGVGLFLIVAGLALLPQLRPPASMPTPTLATTLTIVSSPKVAATSAAAPIMTADEQRVMKDILNSSPQFTATPGDCDRILQSEPWCSVIQNVRRITRSEWEELFPHATFFLVKRHVVGQESRFQQNLLIVEQARERYNAESFQRLLDVNGIVITDGNREIVAKALALMKLADYLEAEIAFSKWGNTDKPASGGMRYNFGLVSWTEIQGLNIEWGFLFYDNSLFRAGAYNLAKNIGNYIDVAFQELPLPSWESLTYRIDR
jgi:hypothetical protein